MTFSDHAWNHIAHIRQAIDAQPFLIDLTDGTLALDKFQHYIIQDSLYLAEYARVLALAAARAPDSKARHEFSSGAAQSIDVETALHQDFFERFQIARGTHQLPHLPSPVCLGYTSYLTMLAATRPYEVLVAAILPCFWIYQDVGSRIKPLSTPGNPFAAWIETYADPDFSATTERVKTIVDVAAASTTEAVRHDMLAAFTQASQYEWMFWDSAYHKRGWLLA